MKHCACVRMLCSRLSIPNNGLRRLANVTRRRPRRTFTCVLQELQKEFAKPNMIANALFSQVGTAF